MNAALDQAGRSALERFVQRARRLLEDDLAREAEGRYGIHVADGDVEDEDDLRLERDALAARRDVVEILEHLQREEDDPAAAVARLVREAAFTHLNRLVAIRIAEAIGMLRESLASGPASSGFKEVLEVAPLLAHDATAGYWHYLQLCGDELAADMPQLFDPRNPLLELAPSPAAIDELIALIGTPELGEAWTASDTLGWAYQFFNSGDERRAMREESASPRNSRELAVRNQFFTPRYVVDFLVQNSLGRRLLDARPDSPLIDDLPLLLDPPTEPGEPLELDDVRVLDPACGSGHFLLGAYDVLERAWSHAGVQPEEAAPAIVASLWGIDIDPRCAQVASAAVILRARRHCRTTELPTPNILTARALPEPAGGWDDLLESLPVDRRRLVRAVRDALEQAPVLGPLLKVEELLSAEIRAHVAGADARRSDMFAAAGVAEDAFGRAEADVLEVLQQLADSATSTAGERLFAAEANDAIRFVEAMRQRYDAVLMNPPFGEPVASTKTYLKAAYPWAPTKDTNLLALFVGRGLELCRPGGSTGAITSRVCMFLKTFEDFREQVLVGRRMRALADLGFGVMEQALVEAAAYVIDAAASAPSDQATFVRLLKETGRESALAEATAAHRAGVSDRRVFVAEHRELTAIPGAPLAYWMGDSLRRLFTDLPRLEGNGAEARQGLASGDDFRFLRLAWEVPPQAIARSVDDTFAGQRWVPFAKGGEYSPYWADVHLVLDWAKNGEALRGFPGARPQNTQYFFRPGLTWPPRTNSGFAPRVLPAGCAFGHKGPAVMPVAAAPLDLLAWLNSRVAQALIDSMVAAGEEVSSGGASRSYEVGLVQKLPWPAALAQTSAAEVVQDVVRLRRELDTYDETSSSFVAPALPVRGHGLAETVAQRVAAEEERSLRILELTHALDEAVADAIGLDDDGRTYLDSEIGPHPNAYPHAAVYEDRLAALYQGSIEQAIDELIEERGGSRAIANLTYFADRRLEVLAHGMQVRPAAIIEQRRRVSLLPPEEPSRTAADLFSYLVGLAFGRWDVRAGADDGRRGLLGDPFGERARCAPGMLLGPDGLPASSPPPGYPLRIPPAGVLVDENGHDWDVERAVTAAAEVLFDGRDELLGEILAALSSRSLRSHLRSKFFKEHLARYSKSRRKAPIYWQLTVPSGKWGVWVYAPRLSRETLYAIAAEAFRREGHAAVEVERLERERATGGAGRGTRALDSALEEERKLAEELRRFRLEAERIASLGWTPDPDDGAVLCAAPLVELFPQWRKELLEYRKQLREKKYPWASVSKLADEL